MFTGIVEAIGRMESLERGKDGGRLRVGFSDAPRIAAALQPGSSIAVNGCCLTVVDRDAESFLADLSAETLRRTSFAEGKAGRLVNLELPLAAGAPLGGHFVQGHVDGVGRIARFVPQSENWWLSLRIPEELRRYVARKGSLAVDGISLTVAGFADGIADFAIIPHTCAHTGLRELAAGDAVNLECDILAKYVESLLKNRAEQLPERLTLERMIEEGF